MLKLLLWICTKQITHEKTIAWDLLDIVKKEIPEAIIFADVSSYEEAAHAIAHGADIVAPTLYAIPKKLLILKVLITDCLRRCVVILG